MEKREPMYTVGENVNWFIHCGKQYRGFLHIELPIPLLGIYLEKNENTKSKRYVHPSVFHNSTVYSSQDMEAT